MRFIALALILGLALGGCSAIAKIPDNQLAADIQLATYNSSYFGFKAVLNNNPGRVDQLTKDATIVVTAIRTNILPIFNGETTNQAVADAVNTAFANLNVDPTVSNMVKVGINLVLTEIPLPANPADKLDARTKEAISALFAGIANGLEQAVKEAPTK